MHRQGLLSSFHQGIVSQGHEGLVPLEVIGDHGAQGLGQRRHVLAHQRLGDILRGKKRAELQEAQRGRLGLLEGCKRHGPGRGDRLRIIRAAFAPAQQRLQVGLEALDIGAQAQACGVDIGRRLGQGQRQIPKRLRNGSGGLPIRLLRHVQEQLDRLFPGQDRDGQRSRRPPPAEVA